MKSILFPKNEFNARVNNLLSNGYEEYLTTMEGGITHVIMTNTSLNSAYNGSVVDIWDDGRIEYSEQFKGLISHPA